MGDQVDLAPSQLTSRWRLSAQNSQIGTALVLIETTATSGQIGGSVRACHPDADHVLQPDRLEAPLTLLRRI